MHLTETKKIKCRDNANLSLWYYTDYFALVVPLEKQMLRVLSHVNQIGQTTKTTSINNIPKVLKCKHLLKCKH